MPISDVIASSRLLTAITILAIAAALWALLVAGTDPAAMDLGSWRWPADRPGLA